MTPGNIQTAFDHLKAANLLNTNYLEELFIIGKLSDDESVKAEVLERITEFTDKGTLKVFRSNTKIPSYGNQSLPASFANLLHLKELKLHITTLTEIPDFIRELHSLTSLKLEGSHYSYSPNHFSTHN